jgi:hypothetical protein
MNDPHPIKCPVSPECFFVLKHHRYTPTVKRRNGRYVERKDWEGICVGIELQVTVPNRHAIDVWIASVSFERSPDSPFSVHNEYVQHDWSGTFQKLCIRLGIVDQVRNLFGTLGVLEAFREDNR